VFGRAVPSGQKLHFWTKVGELNDGSSLEVPIIVVNGAADGPLVCLIGGNHGDEYNGPAVISRLYQGLEPGRVKGAVIGVPIVNPLAFYTVSRTVTLDYEHFNFNRIWPGNPEGFLTQRIAHAIFTECVARASHLIDYHDGGRDLQARFLIVGGTAEARRRTYDATMRMARAYGHGIPIFDSETTPEEVAVGWLGTLSEVAAKHGIPTLVLETGGGATMIEEDVEAGVTGTRNILKELGLLDGTQEQRDRDQTVVRSSTWLRPEVGGFLELYQPINATVKAGTLMFRVMDPFGTVREEKKAPFDCIVLDVRLRGTATPGEWVYHCGKL
jgi:predicted deacylase